MSKVSKMGAYQVGHKWLNESMITETPAAQVDKAVEKALGTDEVFFTGEHIRDGKIKKLFVLVPALNAANDAVSAGDEAAEAKALKSAQGKIFAVTFGVGQGVGKDKVFYDIAVIGNKAQAQKMSKLFLSALSAKLPGISLGEEKVKASGDQAKSGSELATLSDHPFLSDAWFIESVMPFTIEG